MGSTASSAAVQPHEEYPSLQIKPESAQSYVLLILLCCALFLPGLTTLPPIDRDEARFAQATRQMFEGNDFIRISFQNEPRHKKPIGIYWLQAASVKVFGDPREGTIWPYRVPSFIGATLAVLLTFALGRRFFDSNTAMLGAALTAGCLITVVEAHQATTDAALLATAVAAQGSLAVHYVRARSGKPSGIRIPVLFWVAQGTAILLKGPIVPAISALTVISILIADRDRLWLKGLHPFTGLAIVALLVSPWAVAITRATEGAFFGDAIRGDLLPKLISGHESHGFPPGYYLLLLPLTFWPAFVFLVPALRWAWNERTTHAVRFCLAWAVPAWIMFELVPTKLPHYVMPLYPALALLTARALHCLQEGSAAWPRFSPKYMVPVSWSIGAVITSAAIIALPWVLEEGFQPVTLIPAAAAVAFAAACIHLFRRNHLVKAAAVSILGIVAVFSFVFQVVLPGIDALWLSRTTARSVSEYVALHTDAGPVKIVAAGYHEPSLVFLLGTETTLLSPAEAALTLIYYPDSIAVVDNKSLEAFLDRLAACQATPELLKEIKGINYSKGRRSVLRIYTLASGCQVENEERSPKAGTIAKLPPDSGTLF